MELELELDRMNVPAVFFTPKAANENHKDAFSRVFTESGDHFRPDWITVGYVSKQTPFGQGTFLGFEKSQLRGATREEVLTALSTDHPHGRGFRPHCCVAADASFHLAMSSAIRNWTNDNPGGTPPIHDVSRDQIRNAGETAQRKHNRMMNIWRLTCWKQARAIRKAFAS